jgi:predicted nucleotide-binding protein with TIR-like domain
MRSERLIAVRTQQLIVTLEAYKAEFERILRRFISDSDSLDMDTRDRPAYRQKVEELRDLLAEVGLHEYSHQIVGFFNQGITNYFESPSFASVENIVSSLGAVLTRLNRMVEQGREELPVRKPDVQVRGLPTNSMRRVFIGHGHSSDWRELKEFIVDRLGLEYDEFNRIPPAGKSNKERLKEMLDACGFALIVMTGEDEAKDGRVRARENVVHEAGLFQGKLGFERAIILLEDGCEEFSNIEGLIQLRFPPGNIISRSEEIRRTLEREGLISTLPT